MVQLLAMPKCLWLHSTRFDRPAFLVYRARHGQRFPNHYSGDGSVATRELGEWNMNNWIAATVEAIRAAKADDQSLKLQNEFYEKSKHPLDTRP